MFVAKLRNHIKVPKCILPVTIKANQLATNQPNPETLSPVTLSYATYETTTSNTASSIPPLLVMHGLFGSKTNFNSLCKVYQQKTDPQRNIIAIDARNHGDSERSKYHTYAHMAADIKALLQQLKITKAVLMGHSMGGRAVMLVALKYPEIVERLIVADISPIAENPSLGGTLSPKIFQALENVNLPSNISMSQARAAVDLQLVKTIPDKAVRAFLLTNLVQGDSGRWENKTVHCTIL